MSPEQLFDRHLEWAQTHSQYLALRYMRSAWMDWDDGKQAAMMGFLQACSKFDASENVKFQTFAAHRMYGSVMDLLREIDPLSRVARTKLNEAGKKGTRAIWRNGDEVIDYKEVSMNSLIRYNGNEDEPRRVEYLELLGDSAADEMLTLSERQSVIEALMKLNDRERFCVTMHFYEGMSMREIGEYYGVTESRISQIIAKALSRMRGNLPHAA